MQLELYIIFHHTITTVTSKSPVSCSKALGDRVASLWKWWKGGQGNENGWRRSLHLQCLYRCARKSIAAILLAWLQHMHTWAFLHPDLLRNMWQIQFVIVSCGCQTPVCEQWHVHDEHGWDLADSWDLSASDVANGMAAQINLRAPICLVFGLASPSFECSLPNILGWELTM